VLGLNALVRGNELRSGRGHCSRTKFCKTPFIKISHSYNFTNIDIIEKYIHTYNLVAPSTSKTLTHQHKMDVKTFLTKKTSTKPLST